MDWNISPTLELLLLSQVLEVLTHLPPSAKCWDYRNIPLHQVHKGARNQIQSMLGKHSTKDFILSSLKAVFIRLIYENQISSWHFHVMKFWFILPTITPFSTHLTLSPSYSQNSSFFFDAMFSVDLLDHLLKAFAELFCPFCLKGPFLVPASNHVYFHPNSHPKAFNVAFCSVLISAIILSKIFIQFPMVFVISSSLSVKE